MIGNAIAGFLGAGVAASTTSYESIQTTTVSGGGASSISFTSIPATFTHLQIRHSATNSSADRFFKIQFNSDTASNYSYHVLQGDGASATASAGATQAFGICGLVPNSTTLPGVGITDVLDYANTNKYKTTKSLAGGDMNGAGGYVILYSSSWRSTSAITSITITPSTGNFSQYSSFALYGIKGA
jgi:hypothetical protein